MPYHTGPTEICNVVDDNCNGIVDTGCTYTNMLLNGDFENWENNGMPVNWYFYYEDPANAIGTNLNARQSGETVNGNYSLELSNGPENEAYLLRKLDVDYNIDEFSGKTLILSIWVKRETGSSAIGWIEIDDGITTTHHDLNQSSDWNVVHIEHTVSNSAWRLWVKLSPNSDPYLFASYYIDWGEIVAIE